MKKCSNCGEIFEWNNDVIVAEDGMYTNYFHEECVTLYPTGYVAYVDGDYLGEVNSEADMAFSVFEPGDYEEEVKD